MDEEEAGAAQAVEGRGERGEVVEPVGADRHAREAGPRPADGERHDPSTRRGGKLEDAVLPDALETLALVGVERLEPERRLERDDRRVDLRRSSSASRAPRSWSPRSSGYAPSPRYRVSASRNGAVSRCASASLKARGQRCWWTSKPDIVRRRSSRSGSPRRAARGRGARHLPRGTGQPADGRAEPRRPRSELRTAEIARLRREHELDRHDPRAELDHLGEPPGGERRHRHPVLDALGLGRRDELERDGLRQEPRLDGDRLDGDAVLAEGALGHGGALTEPLGQTCQVPLQELHGALGRGRDRGRESEPRQVERRRERLHLEVADRDHPVLVDDDERVRLRGVELDRELRGRRSRRRRGRRRSAARSSGT